MRVAKCLGVLLAAALFAATAPGAKLVVQAIEADGEPVWARFEIRDEQGRSHMPAFALRDRTASARSGDRGWYLGSFVSKDPASIELPAGQYTVVAERGLEYERFEEQIEVGGEQPAELTIRLDRWINMNELGWWSGDMHVHRPVDDAPSLALAEDLNLSAVFTVWNDNNHWDSHERPENPFQKVTPRHVVSLVNAEDERGGGAWMLHGLRNVVDWNGSARWYPPGIHFVDLARQQKYFERGLPWFDLEKPFWWEAPVMVALATPDSMGILHNHFNQYGVLENEAWGRTRDAEKYPGREGFMQASMDLYYRYLNLGYKIPPSAGSASGVLPNPVGYNRVYVQPDGPFTAQNWYLALHEGPSFVTNGPMLFFEAYQLPKEIRLRVAVESREPLDRVEIIGNGQIVTTLDVPEGETSFQTELGMDGGIHTWVAARVFSKNPHTIHMAHSRPRFLVDAYWDARADAQFFVEWMDELITETEGDPGRFANDQQSAEVLELYHQARRVYAIKAQ